MDEGLRQRRLLERAGFGPRPGSRDALRREGAEAWLAGQLARRPPSDAELAGALDFWSNHFSVSARKSLVGALLPHYEREVLARELRPRAARAAHTRRGRRVAGEGVEEGENLLRWLARHPSTARHVSRKLVARFVADDPPPALVDRAARRFLETEGTSARWSRWCCSRWSSATPPTAS